MSQASAATLRRWRESPAAMVKEAFGVDPDPWQIEVLSAFPSMNPEHMRIGLKACAGPGKTALLAWLGINFLTCYGSVGQHPKGAAVSITSDNLKDNLWPEFAKWMGRSEYLKSAFRWEKERIFAKDHPETWFLSARSWPKTANPDEQGKTLSGIHSEYVLILIDESGAIPTPVLRAGEQALFNCKFGKIVQAGNPISHEGMLYAADTTLRHQWFMISVSGDPENPKAWVHSPRFDGSSPHPADVARDQINTYGRDNPWVMAYILGQFPPSSINTVLGVEEVNAALGKHLTEDVYSWAQKRLGIDVARFGDDRSVIFPRQGLAAFKPVVMRHQRTTDIAARVAQAKVKWGSEMEFVDDSGHWGHGVIDNLFASGYSPMAVIGEAPAVNPRYFNKRAECWMEMAEWVRRGGALPRLPELVRELTAPTYTFNNGKIQIEDKKLMKKRIGVSPDLADALAYTFAMPDMPGQTPIGNLISALEGHGGMKSEYDPLERAD